MRDVHTRLARNLLGGAVAVLLVVGAPGVALPFHSADYNVPDWSVNLSELLRAIQFYNVGEYSCDPQGEDGYVAGAGDKACAPHDSDYNVQDWAINLSELLRLIQFYNTGVYHEDPSGEDGYAPGPAPSIQVAVTGQVTGSGPLPGVTVSAGAASTETGAEGFFLLENVAAGADGRVVVTFEKAGYARTQKAAQVAGRQVVDVPATLLPHTVSESVDPGVAQDLQGFNGASEMIVRFVLPADALVGAAPGNVTVSLTYGDPSTEFGIDAFPGEFLAAPAQGELASIPIESVVFADIVIVDSQGTEITEFSTPAEILLRLPDDFQSGGTRADTFVPGDPEKGWIPWWTYDEVNSSWYRDDANPEELGIQDAQVLDIGGALYSRARLTHLTPFNVDVPIPTSCLEVQVVDPDGNTLPGITVRARGTTYSMVDSKTTDDNGLVQLLVKRSDPLPPPERAVVTAYYGSLRYPYDVVDEAEGRVDTDQIFTPPQLPVCQPLKQPIEMTIVGTIRGTVLHGDEPVDTAVYLLGSTTANRTDPATGEYRIEGVPLDREVFLKVEGAAVASARVMDPRIEEVVNFSVNEGPAVSSMVRTPEGSPVAPGTTVLFSITADDPDGDEFTVSWAATDGSPLTQVEGPVSGAVESVFEWVAPASPQTVSISVAVEDSLGAITRRSMDVVVGGGTGGRLTVTVRDDPVSNQVVPGSRVVLYESDNVTVADHKLTDPATGVADFGVLDRDRVTVAIANETSTDPFTVFRVFHMFVDVPSGEWVYYLYGARDRLFSCPAPDAILRIVSVETPFAAQRAWLEPMGWADFSSPIGFLEVPVCRDAVQEDGTFMPLVLGFEGVFGNTSVHWFRNEEDAIEVPPLAPGGLRWKSSGLSCLHGEARGLCSGRRIHRLLPPGLPWVPCGRASPIA